MGLIEQATLDIQRITQDTTGFGLPLVLIWPDESSLAIVGLHTVHSMTIDPETGQAANAKNAHASFSELPILAAGKSIRNADGEYSLAGFKLKGFDRSGRQWTYMVREWYPDQTVALIVCILGDYVEN